jgi:hypothetical protein
LCSVPVYRVFDKLSEEKWVSPGLLKRYRQALVTLYSNEIVDIRTSTDVVSHLPVIMDRALAGAACPFKTYRESLNAFARALYALHVEDGRCTSLSQPNTCGLYDPNHLYNSPTTSRVTYIGIPLTYDAAVQSYPAGIQSSFGVDFVEIDLDPSTDGQPLAVEVHGAPGAAAVFDVQVWALIVDGNQLIPVGEAILLKTDVEGRVLHTLPALDSRTMQRLAVIITRVDAEEHVDPVGAYTLYVYPGSGKSGLP